MLKPDRLVVWAHFSYQKCMGWLELDKQIDQLLDLYGCSKNDSGEIDTFKDVKVTRYKHERDRGFVLLSYVLLIPLNLAAC
jgi:hypothetical protein